MTPHSKISLQILQLQRRRGWMDNADGGLVGGTGVAYQRAAVRLPRNPVYWRSIKSITGAPAVD